MLLSLISIKLCLYSHYSVSARSSYIYNLIKSLLEFSSFMFVQSRILVDDYFYITRLAMNLILLGMTLHNFIMPCNCSFSFTPFHLTNPFYFPSLQFLGIPIHPYLFFPFLFSMPLPYFLLIIFLCTPFITATSFIEPPTISLPQDDVILIVNMEMDPIIPLINGDDVRVHTLPSLPNGLRIDKFSGKIYGKPTDIMSRSRFTIAVKNQAGDASAVLSITVTDKTEEKPSISLLRTIYSFTRNSHIQPIQPTIRGKDFTISVVPSLPFGLSLNSTNGFITGTPKYESYNQTYTMTVSNHIGCDSALFQMEVKKEHSKLPLIYIDETNCIFTQGTEIIPIIPYIEGDNIVISVVPALPKGLRLDEQTGVISGMPGMILDKTAFTVTVKNAISSSSAFFNIMIESPYMTFPEVKYDQSEYVFVKGEEIEPIIPKVNGGGLTMNFLPALPFGLKFDPDNGVITGTPFYLKEAKVYTLHVVNKVGQRNIQLTISVVDFIPSTAHIDLETTDYTLQQGAQMLPITPTLQGEDVVVTIYPPLPYGMTLNAATGVIKGAPKYLQDPTLYTLSASNSISSDHIELHITVIPYKPIPPTIHLDSTDYSFTINHAIQPIQPAITGSDVEVAVYPALVDGLTLNKQTGVISGTPLQLKDKTSFTLVAVNKVGHATVSFNMTIEKEL